MHSRHFRLRRLFLPLPPLHEVLLRLPQCCFGIALAGFAFAVMIKCGFGLGPWEVLADGVHRQTGVAVGTAAILVSLFAFACWIPLKQKVGIGTLISIFLFGETTNLTLPLLPTPSALWQQFLYLPLPVVLWGLGIALYISTGLGPGPRDGIMTALAGRGHSVRIVRTATEVVVLVVGVVLRGRAGIGTLLFALAIGPCIFFFLEQLNASRLSFVRSATTDTGVVGEGI